MSKDDHEHVVKSIPGRKFRELISVKDPLLQQIQCRRYHWTIPIIWYWEHLISSWMCYNRLWFHENKSLLTKWMIQFVWAAKIDLFSALNCFWCLDRHAGCRRCPTNVIGVGEQDAIPNHTLFIQSFVGSQPDNATCPTSLLSTIPSARLKSENLQFSNF